MKPVFRKDIWNYYLKNCLNEKYKTKEYRFYEIHGLIYAPNYEKNRIVYFEHQRNWFVYYEKLLNDIEDRFNIKFQKDKNCDIVCRCGESQKFSSYYGVYKIILKCNACGNKFVAYSG